MTRLIVKDILTLALFGVGFFCVIFWRKAITDFWLSLVITIICIAMFAFAIGVTAKQLFQHLDSNTTLKSLNSAD